MIYKMHLALLFLVSCTQNKTQESQEEKKKEDNNRQEIRKEDIKDSNREENRKENEDKRKVSLASKDNSEQGVIQKSSGKESQSTEAEIVTESPDGIYNALLSGDKSEIDKALENMDFEKDIYKVLKHASEASSEDSSYILVSLLRKAAEGDIGKNIALFKKELSIGWLYSIPEQIRKEGNNYEKISDLVDKFVTFLYFTESLYTTSSVEETIGSFGWQKAHNREIDFKNMPFRLENILNSRTPEALLSTIIEASDIESLKTVLGLANLIPRIDSFISMLKVISALDSSKLEWLSNITESKLMEKEIHDISKRYSETSFDLSYINRDKKEDALLVYAFKVLFKYGHIKDMHNFKLRPERREIYKQFVRMFSHLKEIPILEDQHTIEILLQESHREIFEEIYRALSINTNREAIMRQITQYVVEKKLFIEIINRGFFTLASNIYSRALRQDKKNMMNMLIENINENGIDIIKKLLDSKAYSLIISLTTPMKPEQISRLIREMLDLEDTSSKEEVVEASKKYSDFFTKNPFLRKYF